MLRESVWKQQRISSWSTAWISRAPTVFRSYYLQGRNYLVSPAGDPGYTKRFGAHEVRICTPSELIPTERQ